jgi:beta-glucosidase
MVRPQSRRTLLRTAVAAAVAAPLVAACDPATRPGTATSAMPAHDAAEALPFPTGFAWGASTAAYQIEGATNVDGRGPSIWDTFSHRPGTIVDGSTGDVACDHYHRYASDLDLMKRLGIMSYRFSIAWSRVLPTGRTSVNQKGLDFYRRLVDGLHARGIAPLVTLYHWDLPQALQDQGGWENRDCADWFADYAQVVFRALGSAVPTWLTINEPKTIVHDAYLTGAMAPGKRDPVAAAVVTHHLALAHGRAVQAFRAEGTGHRIGPCLSLTPIYPSGAGAEQAVTARDGDENRKYLDPIFNGSYPADVIAALPAGPRRALLAAIQPGDLTTISTPVDLLGFNYYSPGYVDAAGHNLNLRPRSRATWEQIYPPGLTDLLVRLSRDVPHTPLVVIENGIPDPSASIITNDAGRISYLHDHIAAARRAIQAGVRLEGYHVWALFDNFEWAQGFSQRWGLVSVDFATQRRTPKRSASWYRDVIARNGL